MDSLLAAVLTGTAIGAVVTGLFSLAKPWIDFWVARATRRWTEKEARKIVVEEVVERLRKLRVENYRASRDSKVLSYEMILEASDSALLIHDQQFARYLSDDIANVDGFYWLHRYWADNSDFTGDPSETARTARMDHLKTLVDRASAYAVTGKWDKEWAGEAVKLREEMDEAAKKVHNP